MEGQRRTGDGDPGDEGGENADCQDRSDHGTVSPDHLPGTESSDSNDRVTPPSGVQATPHTGEPCGMALKIAPVTGRLSNVHLDPFLRPPYSSGEVFLRWSPDQ